MRRGLLIGIITGFVLLGLWDLAHGHARLGVSGLLLAAVNGLLLTP